jgi:hypothetical protein
VMRRGDAVSKRTSAIRLSRVSNRIDAQRLHDGEATTDVGPKGLGNVRRADGRASTELRPIGNWAERSIRSHVGKAERLTLAAAGDGDRFDALPLS